MLQCHIPSVFVPQTRILILSMWLRWLTSVVTRIQILETIPLVLIMMVMIAQSDRILSTINSCLHMVSIMSYTSSSLVIHDGKKLLVLIVRKFGTSCLRSGVVLKQRMPGGVRSMLLDFTIHGHLYLRWTSPTQDDIGAPAYFISYARRPNCGRVVVSSLRYCVDWEVSLLPYLLMVRSTKYNIGVISEVVRMLTLGSCWREWLRARQSSWFLVTATAAAVDALKPSLAYCC